VDREKIFSHKYSLKIFLIIVLFLIFTRLYNLRTNPKWYWDEAHYINMEYNLANGEVRQGAIKYPFGMESTPRMPLYYFLSGIVMKIFNNKDILYPRFLSFMCTLGIIFPLFMIGKLLFNEKVALLGLAIFTLHKFPLIFNRWGVEYNADMFFNVWTLYALVSYLKYKKVSSLIFSAIFSGLFALSSFYGLPVVLFVILFTFFYNKKALVYIAPIAIAPFIIFGIWMSMKTQGEFWKSFITLFSSGMALENKKSIFEQISGFIKAFLLFPSYDLIYFLSIVGLFFLKGRQHIITLFLLPIGMIIIKRQGLDTRTSYNSVLYLPILHLSIASLLFIFWERVKNSIKKYCGGLIHQTQDIEFDKSNRYKLMYSCTLIIALLPFIFIGTRDTYWVMTRIPTNFDTIGAIQDYDDTMDIVDFINLNTNIDKDVVIAPELISWLIDCKTVNLYQVLLSLGYETLWHNRIPDSRWAFKIDYKEAKFLILDYTNRSFTLYQENMDKFIAVFKKEKWELILQQGEYFMYLNPRFNGTAIRYIE